MFGGDAEDVAYEGSHRRPWRVGGMFSTCKREGKGSDETEAEGNQDDGVHECEYAG